MELPLKVLLNSQKWLGRKNTTLLCVTHRINRTYLNFKHQFHNMTYRLILLKLKNIQSQLQKHVKTTDKLAWKYTQHGQTILGTHSHYLLANENEHDQHDSNLF